MHSTSLSLDPDPLLATVEDFLIRSGLTATAFGAHCLNDPTLVHEMRKGRECKRLTRKRILAFIDDYTQALATGNGE